MDNQQKKKGRPTNKERKAAKKNESVVSKLESESNESPAPDTVTELESRADIHDDFSNNDFDFENDSPHPLDIQDDSDMYSDKNTESSNTESTKSDADEVPEFEFDPLDEPIKKRTYTSGQNPNQTQPEKPISQEFIPEPQISPNDPLATEPIIEPKGKSGQAVSEPQPKKPNVNPRMDDMSPSQKRKAAEKTAEALVTTYAQVIPPIFTRISQYNIPKLQRAAMQDEINLNLRIDSDGTTVLQYVQHANIEIEKTFVVTKEMQEEIKEPLIEVLMENNMALTPTQRLLLAIGGQLVGFTVATMQIVNAKKHAMEMWKEFHRENRNGNKQQQQQQYTPPPSPENKTYETPPPETEVVMNAESNNDITDVDFKETPPVKNKLKMEDIVETGLEVEETEDDVV